MVWNPEICGDKAIYLSINFYLSEPLLKVISTENYFNALLISGEMEFDIDKPATFLEVYKDSLPFVVLCDTCFIEYLLSNKLSVTWGWAEVLSMAPADPTLIRWVLYFMVLNQRFSDMSLAFGRPPPSSVVFSPLCITTQMTDCYWSEENFLSIIGDHQRWRDGVRDREGERELKSDPSVQYFLEQSLKFDHW